MRIFWNEAMAFSLKMFIWFDGEGSAGAGGPVRLSAKLRAAARTYSSYTLFNTVFIYV